MQDDLLLATRRFIALAREPLPPLSASLTNAWKTSIVFSLAEGAGVLFKALSCFALRGIDLTKIERCVRCLCVFVLALTRLLLQPADAHGPHLTGR